jgi:ketosteroid isomerase-like protein
MKVAFGLVVLVVLFGTGQADPQRAELLRLAERMLEDVRNRDPEAVIAHYDGGPAFVHIENGVAHTWPELQEQMRTFMPAMRENNLRWIGTPSVVLLSQDAAIIHGRHRFMGVDAAGTAVPPHDGYWTGVMRRTPAGWKIAHSHSSDLRSSSR